MSFWDAGLPQLMNEALVPGASLAIIRGGRIAEVVICGVRHSRSPLSVDENTVFDAASLSKPIPGRLAAGRSGAIDFGYSAGGPACGLYCQ